MKTTREAAKEASHKQMVKHLQDLLDRNYDAEKGYKEAMEHTENISLKHFLRDQAALRNHFATEIDKMLHEINEHPQVGSERKGLGNLHQFWLNFTKTFSKPNDEKILEKSIKDEKEMIRHYEEKMRKFIFPVSIKERLMNHVGELRKRLSEVKILEDIE
ncbi:hypothetical protein C7S20_14295 [Christiangramia fulva]|uniref:DUF2383 domain-containing protein n=1 Tax=Christiangramia fulva TaxID=2126553 RepID=A0A2R3Z7U4_9FLAO|nr:PA2169 family four-helix-bundle protein [Christiangramia fulva]AVR46340.1 hypothetical protein C7S20_14295 [Christiangramia fulva]